MTACKKKIPNATWTAVEGNGRDLTDPNSENSWENQALFDFDGVALPALLEFEGQNSRANGSNNVAVFQRSTP